MKRKVVGIFFVGLMIQLVLACCPGESVEFTITNISARTLQINDNVAIELTNTSVIPRNELILEILIGGTQFQIGENLQEVKDLALPQASHAAIDCDEPSIILVNQIIDLEVFAVDENNAESDISGDVLIRGTQLTISEYLFDNDPTVGDGLLLVFGNTANIPDTASFRIVATLSGGNTVEFTTNQVNFI